MFRNGYVNNLSVTIFLFAYCIPFGVQASSVNINLDVLVCNGNLVCEDVTGETYASCSSDCEPPPVATSTPSSGGGGQAAQTTGTTTVITNYVKESAVNADTHSAVLSIKTLLSSVVSISWGKTLDNEIGSLAEAWYHNDFKVKLENLEPNTKYYYKVNLKDSFNGIITYSGEFVTDALPDMIAPDAPFDFSAYLNGDRILLNWKDPISEDLSVVRLVRSDIFYPISPTHGKVIYEGLGTYVNDSDVVPGKLYFYTIFAIDKNGNASSGAIVSVYVPVKKINPKPKTSTSTAPYDPLLNDIEAYIIPDFAGDAYGKTFCNARRAFSDNEFIIDAGQLSVLQLGKPLSFAGNSIPIDPKYPVTITLETNRIDAKKVRGLALCVGSFIPEIRRGYLFQYNTNTKKFEVEMPTSLNNHDYDFYIGMLQYMNKESVLMNGEFIIKKGIDEEKKSNKVLSFLRNNIFIIFLWMILMIAVLLLIRFRLFIVNKLTAKDQD